MICEALNWAHLPEGGGIYAQSPQLLEEWLVIWKAKSDVAEEKKLKEEQKQRAIKQNARGRR